MAIKLICNGKDISSYVSTITWSGEKTQAARKLDINLVDSNKINCGNSIIFYYNNIELFRGHVFTKGKTQSSKMISITAFDSLIYLIKSSGTYNFKKITPENITKKVCADFNIPIGNVISTNVHCNILFNNKNIYNIIMTAYTKAEKVTNNKYMPVMKQGKLNIIIKGDNVISYNPNCITETDNTESVENMINEIKAYDDKNNYIGTIENINWIKQFGILQSVEAADKKSLKSLKNMLKDIEKTVSMNGIGNINCITGNAIKIKVQNGISGLFFIDGDSHTWQDGNYTMQLTLNYQNIMDEQNDNDKTEEGAIKKGSNKKAPKKGKLATKKSTKKAKKVKADAQVKKALEDAIKEFGG